MTKPLTPSSTPTNYSTVDGARLRAGYETSVRAILGAETPKVSSRGLQFYNKDRWTSRTFVVQMCQWAKANPQGTPTLDNIRVWCAEANAPFPDAKREIVIASTPYVLPQHLAWAMTGGAYHEAFHTKYSRRSDLDPEDMARIVLPRWVQVKDWAPYAKELLTWSNIVEDILIERTGRVDYPGTEEMLWYLQDLILTQEHEDVFFGHGRGHGPSKKKTDPNVPKPPPTLSDSVKWVFRDRGHEYTTERQRGVWQKYLQTVPLAVGFVIGGPLSPILKKVMTTAASPENDLDSLTHAMDICILLDSYRCEGEGSSDEGEPEAVEGEPGDGKTECPSCGAPARRLVVRPLFDGAGVKVPGKGICTCMDCGFQQEVNIGPPSKNSKNSKEPGPRFIGFNPEDFGSSPDQASTFEVPSKELFEGNDWGEVGQTLQTEAESRAGDDASEDPTEDEPLEALSEAVREEMLRLQEMLLEGEQVWNPFDPELDVSEYIKPSAKGFSHDLAQADILIRTVTRECAFLRARLSNLFRALEMTDTLHGFPEGDELSEPLLVDTYVDIQAKQVPHRAFQRTDERLDMSFAAAIVIDESGSMSSCLKEAAQTLIALTEPLDRLGIPVMASGFQDGNWGRHDMDVSGYDPALHHRQWGKTHDVFKSFEERFQAVKWRFANTKATGGTPMADGMQFGLAGLQQRPETYRILFVITDGDETEGSQVMNWQFRAAKKAGIHVIGVGIGPSAEHVKVRFPDHVWAPTFAEIPPKIVGKLNDLIELRSSAGNRIIKTPSQIKTPW